MMVSSMFSPFPHTILMNDEIVSTTLYLWHFVVSATICVADTLFFDRMVLIRIVFSSYQESFLYLSEYCYIYFFP